ncbi:MAG: hypothetical protein AMK70_10725 [Nitrospira bacterium SG8_35_1]|nr:MAG: hypothetical protein AMK70_10725 [Nitrospira bacterium SG8_35_1]
MSEKLLLFIIYGYTKHKKLPNNPVSASEKGKFFSLDNFEMDLPAPTWQKNMPKLIIARSHT